MDFRSKFSRRQFVRFATNASLTAFVPISLSGLLSCSQSSNSVIPGLIDPELAGKTNETDTPHFFLEVIIPEGADWSYLFDARPLAMTQAGLIQNHIGKDPELWNGTWVTELTKKLRTLDNYFSVLNGVHMSLENDGHTENLNLLSTGKTEGGELSASILNQNPNKKSLFDFFQVGMIFHRLSNFQNGVAMSASTWPKLQSSLENAPTYNMNDPIIGQFHQRLNSIAQKGGLLGFGAKQALTSAQSTENVAAQFKRVKLNTSLKTDLEKNLDFMKEVFKNDLSKSFILGLNHNLDTHDHLSAKKQPEIFQTLADQIYTVIDFLIQTPFNEKLSLLDVTTFVMTSEFSRTMKQKGKPMDLTGTDHNPLTNTFIVGGKGLKSGLVLGESDYRSVDEKLSKLHISQDKDLVKTMGKPFDFETGLAHNEWPETYKEDQFLTLNNVLNTAFSTFGVPMAQLRTLNQSKTPARLIKSLLS